MRAAATQAEARKYRLSFLIDLLAGMAGLLGGHLRADSFAMNERSFAKPTSVACNVEFVFQRSEIDMAIWFRGLDSQAPFQRLRNRVFPLN
jgi:hypothetical protein